MWHPTTFNFADVSVKVIQDIQVGDNSRPVCIGVLRGPATAVDLTPSLFVGNRECVLSDRVENRVV